MKLTVLVLVGTLATSAILYKSLRAMMSKTTNMNRKKKKKTSLCSSIEMTRVLLPSQADVYGVAHCGILMAWIDVCAGLSAKSHADKPCVTASLDGVHFIEPIFVGDIVTIKAYLNRSWTSSMEVGVSVIAEDSLSGDKRLCCQAFLTFVALHNGLPSEVPEYVPESDVEKDSYVTAASRRNQRFANRNSIKKFYDVQEVDETGIGSTFIPVVRSCDAFQAADNGTARPSSFSYTQNTSLIMPQHANSIGITFGGHIIKLMEDCAVISAARHCQSLRHKEPTLVFRAVSIDSLNFLNPTKVGDIVIVRAYVSRVWHSSVEVYVTVHSRHIGYNTIAEDMDESARYSAKFTNDGYLTFIAVEKDSKNLDEEAASPVIQHSGTKAYILPPVIPCTTLEKWRYEKAQERKELRLREKKKVVAIKI